MSQVLGWLVDWISDSVLALYAPFVYLRVAKEKCVLFCIVMKKQAGHEFQLDIHFLPLLGILRLNGTLIMKSIVINM